MNKNACECHLKNPNFKAFFKDRGKIKESELILKNVIVEFEFA